MKKVLSLILALTLLCVCFAGCGDDEGSSASPASSAAPDSSTVSPASAADVSTSGEVYKIGVLAPAVTHGWSAGVAYYAQQRCEELAADGQIEYKLLTSNNAEEMTSQIDDLRTWGAQAVVAFPQWEGMESPIQALIDDGIYVVNFDIEIKCDGVYRVSGDNEDMGTQSAQYIVDAIGTTGNVIMLNVPTSGSVSELRQKGFEEKLAEIAPDMNVETFATQFKREDGQKDFADILATHDKIDAVFSMDDETSIGVLNAIREANRTDIKVITGGGGCQEYFQMMKDNSDIKIQSTLYSPIMVMDAVDNALALLQGKQVEQVKIIPTTVVDATNCDEYLDASSPY